jgi:hypothetical protein
VPHNGRVAADGGAPTLAVYASTGRTGSTFLFDLFRRSPLAGALHGVLGKRVDQSLPSTPAILANYASRMREAFPDAHVYVEANPRFVERVAQAHGVSDPTEVLSLLEDQGFVVRSLFMIRDPRGYAVSVKNRWREMGRDPDVDPGLILKKKHSAKVYGVPLWMPKPDGFDNVCFSWLLRNRFLGKLMDDERCLFVRFEDLFGSGVSDRAFVKHIQQIHDHLQLPAYGWVDDLVARRHKPRNATSKAEGLSDEQLDQLRRRCGEAAARFGYEL